MSNRFANMLKETLEQMKEKIDMVNKTWEDEIDVPNVKKIEEIAALAGS